MVETLEFIMLVKMCHLLKRSSVLKKFSAVYLFIYRKQKHLFSHGITFDIAWL